MNSEQLAATADPGAFAVYASGGTYHTAPHIEHILGYLREIAAGERTRVEVFAPPRHSKSETLKYFVAWHLGRFPNKTVIVASYNDDLAADFGRAVRRILNAHGKELFGVELSADSAAVNRFSIAGHAGGLYAVGVGGSMTGRGADLMVLDDVIKSDVEALSETTQRRHWNWWRSVVLTRLHPSAAIVAVGTRWSVDDLLGRLAGNRHIDNVQCPQVDLGGTPRTFDHDDVVVVLYPSQCRRHYRPLVDRAVLPGHGAQMPIHLPHHHDLAPPGLRFDQNRGHSDVRLDARRDGLEVLGCWHLEAVDDPCVVRHVDRLERCGPDASASQDSAQRGDQERFPGRA